MGALIASTYFLVNDLGRARAVPPHAAGGQADFADVDGYLDPHRFAGSPAPPRPPRRPRCCHRLIRRVLPPIGTAGGYGAAALAPALATYTAVLLADTATPSWHTAYPELPFVFVAAPWASGAGVGLIAAPSAPVRRMAVIGAAMELWGAHRIETTKGILSASPTRPAVRGSSCGPAVCSPPRASPVRSSAGAAASCPPLSGVSLLAASALTRFGIFDGGVASAQDPKYTVIPQRERLDSRPAGDVTLDG